MPCWRLNPGCDVCRARTVCASCYILNIQMKNLLKILCVCVCVRVREETVCVCVCPGWGAFRSQKRTSDPLELELQRVMSLPIRLLETDVGSSWKKANALNYWTIILTLRNSLLWGGVIETGFLQSPVSWNSICKLGWPWTYRDTPSKCQDLRCVLPNLALRNSLKFIFIFMSLDVLLTCMSVHPVHT